MAKSKDLNSLISLTKTTQALLTHYQSSLALSKTAHNSTDTAISSAELPNPLDAIKACTTLLKSHTTTLSLLLLTPPLTPSALIAKITDVSSSVLSSLVAAAIYTPQAGQAGDVGAIMRSEVRARVRRLLGSWSDVLALVLKLAENRQTAPAGRKDTGPSEAEKQEVLSATGVVWDACDALAKLCSDGIVGLVVKKAGELRATLMDAIEELKEWGEDVDDGEDDGDEDKAGRSDGEDDEDDFFAAENKLGKNDVELKELVDTSVKKLKMIGMLYQAIGKRRLKTFPSPAVTTATAPAVLSPPAASPTPESAASSTPAPTNDTTPQPTPSQTLDALMSLLKLIPETVDDLAGAFYSLDATEARSTLDKCCSEAKRAANLVRQSWTCVDDEFTVWVGKWEAALDGVEVP